MPYKGLLLGNRALPARLAALISILLGLVSLAGWVFGVQAMTSVLPGTVEMKANTALCIILCGTALLVSADRAAGRLRTPALAMALVAVVIGAATLAEYVAGWDLKIDEILVRDTTGNFNVFRGRMSPFSAASFIALGFGVAGLWSKSTLPAAKMAAGISLVVGVVCLLGYLWNAGDITTDRWLPPVAINTALCFVLLGAGALSTPNRTALESGALSAELATIEAKILAGFLIATTLLVGGGAFTYRNSVNVADSVEWIAHTQEVRASLADMFGSLAAADVAQRDFLLTKDRARLEEYRTMTESVRVHLAELARLISDNPTQISNLKNLKRIVEQRLDALTDGLTAFDAYGLAAARAVLAERRKVNNLQMVRDATNVMDVVEVRLLKQREAQATKVRFTTLISLLITLFAASGLFVALFRAIHREMLARRGAEQALLESDRYHRSIIESSPDCVAILNLDGRITQMSPQSMKFIDVQDFSELAGTDWRAFWRGAGQEDAKKAVAAASDNGEGRFVGYCPTRKGVPRWWDVIVMPIRGRGVKPERLVAVARDITEVKRTETNLVATNQFLDSLIENLPLMVNVKTAKDLRFVRVNRATEQLLGLRRESMIGRTVLELFPEADPESLLASDREALQSGKLINMPEVELASTPNGARVLQVMKMTILDAEGVPEFLLSIAVDITERKLAEKAIQELNAELLAKAAQLETTNKELESFSYSASHDLRAPLRAIDGFAEMIEEDFRDKFDAEGRRYLAVIRDNSKRMGNLIDDLLKFSRLGKLPVANAAIDMDDLVSEVIDEALGLAVTLKPAERTITRDGIHVSPLPQVRGDRALLRQVWANLIANAIKYSSKSPVPSIRVTGRLDGAENCYSVEDNGVGFNMEYVQKLFGVFQRLHRADEFGGTGVGLAIVHRIVTRHGGRVWAQGKVNEGAIFSFALPAGAHDG